MLILVKNDTKLPMFWDPFTPVNQFIETLPKPEGAPKVNYYTTMAKELLVINYSRLIELKGQPM